jgi:hypothetical protein
MQWAEVPARRQTLPKGLDLASVSSRFRGPMVGPSAVLGGRELSPAGVIPEPGRQPGGPCPVGVPVADVGAGGRAYRSIICAPAAVAGTVSAFSRRTSITRVDDCTEASATVSASRAVSPIPASPMSTSAPRLRSGMPVRPALRFEPSRPAAAGRELAGRAVGRIRAVATELAAPQEKAQQKKTPRPGAEFMG